MRVTLPSHATLAVLTIAAHAGATDSAPPARSFVESDVVCDRVIDDFAGSELGRFPKGWRTREADEMPFAKSHGLYVVEQIDGRRAIRARYDERAITIGRKVPSWDLDEYPVLQWEWKAVTLPKGGNERDSGHNDSAAGVYAIWDIGFPFYVEGIKYSWSSTIEVGGRYEKRFGHDQLLVVEQGSSRLGKWSTIRVDVHAHRKKFFDDPRPKAPDGIALLTDADATTSAAEAYYANFRLCRKAAAR